MTILIQSYSRMEKSKKDKKKYSGFIGDCSEEQLAALQTFREIVKNINQGVVDPRFHDVYLLRFLRARKFNLKQTEKMWRDFMAWRAKNGVDTLQTYFFPELTHLRKLYPHGYHKYDKKFRPLYIERVGLTVPDEVLKITSEQRLLYYYAMSYERLLTTIFDACTEQKKRQTGDDSPVMQTCTILDLKNIKLSNTSSAYKFVKPASEMAQNNYPEILGNMFIINAPFLFTGIWAIVKMWIDEKTKEKIQILGSGYKKQLLKYIDAENLPDFIDGGLCKCKGGDCLSINVGPWNPEGEEFFPHCLTEVKGNAFSKQLEKEQKIQTIQKKMQQLSIKQSESSKGQKKQQC